MRKYLVILLCLILVTLSSCGSDATSNHPDIEVNQPDGSIINNGESLPESIDKDSVNIGKPEVIVDYYVGSNTTKKFHLKDCPYVQKMKDENKVYLSGYNEFINQGYTPCKFCNP